jgi:hypothetical protein
VGGEIAILKWEERYLEVELSKEQIELAYGKEGLREWGLSSRLRN